MQLKQVGLDPSDYVGRVMDIREAIQAQKRESDPRLGLTIQDLKIISCRTYGSTTCSLMLFCLSRQSICGYCGQGHIPVTRIGAGSIN